MILLWGIPSEPPVALAVAAARQFGLDHAVVNQRRAAEDDIVLDAAGGGWLRLDSVTIDLAEVTGVYVRIMDPHALPETRTGTAGGRDRSEAFHSMLLAWADTTDCRVANPTDAMASNGSKPYQAQLIGAAGFSTPPTLVTNDPREVLRFEAEHGELIFKSTSSERSIVRPLDAAAKQRLEFVRRLPVQFQRRERGTNIRVHVVGERVYSAAAATEALDYRYASHDNTEVELEAFDLPDEVAQCCVRLARSLRLPFCGIDLFHRTDGSWACFEVNPSPGYSWFQERAGLPIAEALVAWLAVSDGY